MRIGALAHAAGTTARAVRHYHRLGLMVEPSRTPGGYRDYSMTDLVRLMRIRWLADSGVPLGAIAAMPTGDDEARDDVVDDLSALIDGLDREQTRLTHRRARLQSLLDDARSGRVLSALPRPLADRLTDLMEGSTESEQRALTRERDLLEVMALSDTVPLAFLSELTDRLADADLRKKYFAVLRRWAALEGVDPVTTPDTIEALAEELASMVPFGAEGSTVGSGSTVDIDDLVPDPAQRAVILRTVDLITTGAVR